MKNITVIFLDYHRKDYTEQVKAKNFNNSGYPFNYVEIEMKGISAAINKGIQEAKRRGADAVVTMANDILMPDNWLKRMVEAWEAIPETGMCGIHCVEGPGEPVTINGVNVRKSYTAFGNVLIPMLAINTIGYFNTDYDPYGMQDSDYAYRLNCTGFVNYYLDGLKSQHIGHDVGLKTDYRLMKDEGLQKAAGIWERSTRAYTETGNYTINVEDWPE